MADAGVIYLYRFAEGETAARKFLASYRAHPAGLKHDLHVILKGFPDEVSLASAHALFSDVSSNIVETDDSAYDIGSYFAAAKLARNDKLMFFNTFSEIKADSWLAYLDRALDLPGIGLVGATGSWQSLSSAYEAAFQLFLRHSLAFLRRVLTSRAGGPIDESATGRIGAGSLMRNLKRAPLYPLYLHQYGRYPNPHIRTNAFMIRRRLFLSLRAPHFGRKSDVYKFESGRRSMTNQITSRGLGVLVVDRLGAIYRIPEWRSSSTFWNEDQCGLMVSDNQTRSYEAGNPKRQSLLRGYAWEPPSSWRGLASMDAALWS